MLLIGIALGAALAAIFGLLAIRASGVYFLMITLALGNAFGPRLSLEFADRRRQRHQSPGAPKFGGIDLANEMTFSFWFLASSWFRCC